MIDSFGNYVTMDHYAICDCGTPCIFEEGCHGCRKKMAEKRLAREAEMIAIERSVVRGAKIAEKRRARRAEIRRLKKAGVYS